MEVKNTKDLLDETDLLILDLLNHDGRLSNKELADKIGLTATPTSLRVRKLEEDGFILGYQARLNKKRIGKGLQVQCHIRLKDHSSESIACFEREVQTLSDVTSCYHIAGDFDYMLWVEVRDMDAYHSFLRETLSQIEYIGNVHSDFVMHTVKE